MRSTTALLAVTAIATSVLADVPYFEVPACPDLHAIIYNLSVPDKADFPTTQVAMCYDEKTIRIDFSAFAETNFYYNKSYTTNDPIWRFEVMEAFIALGTNDPQTYLEFEIAPNNVTFQASIFNPSKVRTEGAAFDTGFWNDTLIDGFSASTTLNEHAQLWNSTACIPLGFFNVDDGQAKGTEWRMNFFRTVVAPDTFPDQLLGAWSVPDQASFHMTPFFGHVKFV